MEQKRARRIAALEKELAILENKEKRFLRSADERRPLSWKKAMEQKIPEKVYIGLESAFGKGFSVVFQKGRVVIEKSYDKKNIQENHAVRDFAFRLKGGRAEIRDIRRSAERSNLLNIAVTTAEGVGLGALGIGMPDIVLFIGMLLKGIYETALNYGYDYEGRYEQLIILKMMAASLCTGDSFRRFNEEVDALMGAVGADITDSELEAQMQATAKVFAVDMLFLKFIQGLPIVGMIGGAANPFYYQKIMRYVQMKYQKRFLQKLLLEEKTGIRLE